MERSGSHLPQALAVKQYIACTVDRRWSLFVVYTGNYVDGIPGGLVLSWLTFYLLIMRLTDFLDLLADLL